LFEVKDLVAQTLKGLEFDLQEQYYLLLSEEEDPKIPPKRYPQAIRVWDLDEARFVEVKVGSADWFSLIEGQKRFSYRYEGLTFTIRFLVSD
jgi:hypothetical protein